MDNDNMREVEWNDRTWETERQDGGVEKWGRRERGQTYETSKEHRHGLGSGVLS